MTVDGVDLGTLGEDELTVFRRRKIGFVFQGCGLVPELTVRENILLPLALDSSWPDAAFFEELASLLGLTKKLDCFPCQLSGGGQQCTAIARSLLTKPAVILADEPTGSFDVKTSQNVAGLLKMTADVFHQTLVMITHNLGVVAQFCHRLYVMYAGKVMESGTVKEIFADVGHPYTEGLMRSVPDMESKERLYNIRGMVPSMLHLPKGCRFCPRCQYSMARCFEEEPEMYEASPGL